MILALLLFLIPTVHAEVSQATLDHLKQLRNLEQILKSKPGGSRRLTAVQAEIARIQREYNLITRAEPPPPPRYEFDQKVFDTAFEFARRPIREGGLGYDYEYAHSRAMQAARTKSLSEQKEYIRQYQLGLEFARARVSSGGLQIVLPGDARDWAMRHARAKDVEERIAKYRIALAHALKPVSKGGRGNGARRASDWARAQAEFKTLAELQKLYPEDALAQGQVNQFSPCFTDRLKNIFGS